MSDDHGRPTVDYASRDVRIVSPSHGPVSRGPLIIAGLLLFIGLQFSLLILHAQWPPKVGQLIFLAVLTVVSAIPSGARVIVSVFDSIRHPRRRGQWLTAGVISAIAVVALLVEARHQLRTFTPRFQDEFSYLIGTRMLAHGRLWMPAHPLAEFFTNFQLLASPVYASCYFPGTAMCFTPGIWLGLPFWIMPLLISGACAGLVYLVFTELVDGVTGIVARRPVAVAQHLSPDVDHGDGAERVVVLAPRDGLFVGAMARDKVDVVCDRDWHLRGMASHHASG